MMTEKYASDNLLQELRKRIQQLQQALAKITEERDQLRQQLKQLEEACEDDGK